MKRSSHWLWAIWMVAASAAGGCTCGSESEPPEPGDDAGPGEPSIASERAKLRFKDARRLQNDFAAALSLQPSELCQELGQYSCVEEIHTVALLGVDPYNLGIYEPLKDTVVTTPIAVERIAVAGCGERVDRDLGGGGAEIFVDLPVTGGAIDDIDDPAVANAIDALYKRVLQRRATAEEIDHHKQLYADVAGLGVAQPAEQWAKGSCIAVLTSLESLFY